MADWEKRFTIQYTVFKEAEVQRDNLEEAKGALIDWEHDNAETGFKKIKAISFGQCTEFNNHPIEEKPVTNGT